MIERPAGAARWRNGSLPAVAALMLATGVCFLVGVGTGYVFDDLWSVVPLDALSDTPELFWSLVLGDKSGPLGRPLTIFSFAVERLLPFASADFSQYVSILLHAVNSLLVFLLAREFFLWRRVEEPVFFAFCVALLWGCTPQKVSSVLYIVQRMTLLSTFFCLSAALCYVRWRGALANGAGSLEVVLWSCLLVAMVACAPFAKENGALALPVLALIELLAAPGDSRKAVAARLRVIALVILAAGGTLFLVYGLQVASRADSLFATRNFSLEDRLALQPLILLDYARQFFVPETATMGLLHDDYPASAPTEGFMSAARIVSLAAVFVVIAAVLRSVATGVRSLVVLGAAWFFVTHSIESVYLPLELYFEHRNYLPSIGLALVAVGLFSRLYARCATGERRLAMSLLAVYLASLCLACISLARWWSSPELLLQHHYAGHPNSSRVNAEMALDLAESGRTHQALVHARAAYDLSRDSIAARPMGALDLYLLQSACRCLAGETGLALPAAQRVVPDREPIRTVTLQLLTRLHRDGICPTFEWRPLSQWIADIVSGAVVGDTRIRPERLFDLARFEYELGNFSRAYAYGAMQIERSPGAAATHILMAQASMRAGDLPEASRSLRRLEELREQGSVGRLDSMALDNLREIVDSASTVRDDPG